MISILLGLWIILTLILIITQTFRIEEQTARYFFGYIIAMMRCSFIFIAVPSAFIYGIYLIGYGIHSI